MLSKFVMHSLNSQVIEYEWTQLNLMFTTPGITSTNLVSGQPPGDGQEYFINIVCVLRWRLHE